MPTDERAAPRPSAPGRARWPGVPPRVSLRAAVSGGLSLVALLALLSAVLLVVLTTRLRDTSDEVARAIDSVRVADEAVVELLLHERTRDPAARAAHESALRQRLGALSEYITSDGERQAFARAQDEIARYIRLSGEDPAATTPALASAYRSLAVLVEVNAMESRVALARAEAADRLANTVGAVTISAVIPLALLMVWWLWTRALDPLFDLGAAMKRFGTGDRGARAHVAGPAELREMSEEFNAMAAELSRQRESQMAFLAGIAHDLRNPLGPLKLAAAVLAAKEEDAGRGDLRKMVAIVRRQVDHLDRMVGDLLEIARIEAGQFELRLNEVDGRVLAEDVVDLFRPTAAARTLQLSVPKDPVPVWCDPLRIQQVLNNLVSNAIKYSHEGSAIVVAVSRNGHRTVFSVTDDGMGVSEEERSRLFEPFRRSERASASPVPGAGLGLFIARRIVEAHGGEITVESAPGRGSTFAVHLPCPRDSAAPGPSRT
ncbi:MAG TPA: HAMP domain-containing sensor histidine kinase [Vicinamibacteria bacterium]|nr:HAMP domain-containing sensor histidine kinase [Vicinamibacteria bacterium]